MIDWKRVEAGKPVMCPACGGTEFFRLGRHSVGWIRLIPQTQGVALPLERIPTVPGGAFYRCEQRRCRARFEAVALPASVPHPPPLVAA